MKKRIAGLFVSLLIIFFFFFPQSFIFASHIPSPSGFVNDFAGVLKSDQQSKLESLLREYEKKTTNEIVVVTVKNLNGGDIDDFAVRTFEEWEIGKKEKDNGVLFLASIEDREMRIEVGYGLEPYLTDSKAGDIIRNIIVPEFKRDNYYLGIYNGVLAIENQLQGSSENKSPPSFEQISELLKGTFVVIIVLSQLFVYIASFLARSKSIWVGGIIGVVIGLIAGLVIGSLAATILLVIISGTLGLIFDWWLSNVYQYRQSKGLGTGWWVSRGGFSRDGFGGFGGGRSGGGGARGGW